MKPSRDGRCGHQQDPQSPSQRQEAWSTPRPRRRPTREERDGIASLGLYSLTRSKGDSTPKAQRATPPMPRSSFAAARTKTRKRQVDLHT